MSKNINVNPGQYKVAGRERQGEDVNHPQEKGKLRKGTEQSANRGRKQSKARGQTRQAKPAFK